MTPADFIAQIGPAARQSMADTKIPASITVAQAALESSWGRAAPGYNLFGIKADRSWDGPVTAVPTHEVVHGRRVAVVAEFRAYPSWLDAITDHAEFLLKNKRYQPCFACTTAKGFAEALQAAGYATDPEYASKLVKIINAHGLERLDAWA